MWHSRLRIGHGHCRGVGSIPGPGNFHKAEGMAKKKMKEDVQAIAPFPPAREEKPVTPLPRRELIFMFDVNVTEFRFGCSLLENPILRDKCWVRCFIVEAGSLGEEADSCPKEPTSHC